MELTFYITTNGIAYQMRRNQSKMFYDSKAWGLYYKTFYGRNLRIFVII
jgi:hypothetical protein